MYSNEKRSASRTEPAKIPAALPVHTFEETAFPVFVKDITHKNRFDSTREHRHNYFEIFFFETGGGTQVIDFMELPVSSNSCYIVFPYQVHLLQRDAGSFGQVVQFREEVIPSVQIKNMLRQISFGITPAIIFENNEPMLEQLRFAIQLLREFSEKKSRLSREITLHYLQALLLQLIENRGMIHPEVRSKDRELLLEFQHLLEAQFLQNHTVQKYSLLLKTTEKKLSAVTRKYLGLTPLQVIHNRVILEAKRMLLFENTSHKEIAYYLGFDSPASFSQFIKNKTGITPSELYTQLVNIHK